MEIFFVKIMMTYFIVFCIILFISDPPFDNINMRRSTQKRSKQQLSQVSSTNKEFLLRFLSKNFERQTFTQQSIKSFNFYLSKQIQRIAKDLNSIQHQIDVCIMLLSSFISNLEQLSQNLSLFPSLNETFYLMMEFVMKCLQCFNSEKTYKVEQWELIDRMLELFDILTKNPRSVPQPNRDDNSDKKILSMNWVDDLPEINKNGKSVLSEQEKMKNLLQLLLTNPTQNYALIVRSSFESYLNKYMQLMVNNLLSLIDISLAQKRTTTSKKALQLFIKLRSDHYLTNRDLINIFQRIRLQDPKLKSIRYYRQVMETIPIEKYLDYDQIFILVLEILKQIFQTLNTQPVKQIVSLLGLLKQSSQLFSQSKTFIKQSQNTYQTILKILLFVHQKGKQQEDRGSYVENACSYAKSICRNILDNSCLKDNIIVQKQKFGKIISICQSQLPSEIQNFILSTFPSLVSFLPQIPTEKLNNFTLSIYLKLLITYINNNPNQNFVDLFNKQYKRSQQKQVTCFDFSVYFCLLSALTMETISQYKIIDMLIQNSISKLQNDNLSLGKTNLLADLVLLINLINNKEYSILRCSAKQFIDKMFNRIQLLNKKLLLPSILTNQALLFTSHQSLKMSPRIVELSNCLNERRNDLINEFSEIYYYILIQIHNLAQKVQSDVPHQKFKEIDIIKRMRISNTSNLISICSSALESSVKSNNMIQIFHSLVKLYSLAQNQSEESHLLSELQSQLSSLLIFMYKTYPITDEQILQLYTAKTKKKQGHLDIFNRFLSHNKEMHVVKFYSQAKNQTKRLHIFIMQIIIRILIKIYNTERSSVLNTFEFKKIHLLYLPIESPFINKSFIQSELQLVYISMYLVSRQTVATSQLMANMKEYLLKQFNKIIQFYSNSYEEVTSIIKFKDFDFLEYLFKKFLFQYEGENQGKIEETQFVYIMLNLLSSQSNTLTKIVELIKNTNFLSQKIKLVFKRLKYQVLSRRCNIQNSKKIYGFLKKINPNCQLFNLNQYLKAICDLDQLKQIKLSIYICKQISLLKNFFIPDEDIVNIVFEYVAKMHQFYEGLALNEGLLVVIPEMICELFGINSKEQSEISIPVLNQLERYQKGLTCAKLQSNGQSSYYRCIQCDQKKADKKHFDDKKLICFNCIINCHQGHTYYFVPSSVRALCNCSAICENGCKLRKNNPNENKRGKDLNMFGKVSRQPGNLPREIRQLRQIRQTFRESLPSSSFGRLRGIYDSVSQISNPMMASNPIGNSSLSFFGAYGAEQVDDNPFSRRMDRYDKFTVNYYSKNNSDELDDDLVDQGVNSGLFKTIAYKKRRQLGDSVLQRIQSRNEPKIQIMLQGLKDKLDQQKAEMEIENQPQSDISDQYQDSKIITKIQQQNGNIIRNQSYLIHIFLGIMEERFVKQNRKISVHEIPSWKLPTTQPILTKLSENSFKIYSTNFKIKMNFDNGNGMRASPMIVRKPIAISESLILVLCSLSIHVFEARKFLAHICNPSTNHPEYLYRHDLLIQAHSIQFLPNNPNILCVAGLKVMQLVNINSDNLISKAPIIAYQNNNNDVINKIQALEIGILISDARSIKLIDLTSKNVLIVIPAPKQGGVIRDWSAIKQTSTKSNLITYNLLVISSYGSIFQVQFDQNDRGEKQLNKKLNGYNKKKDETGVSMYQCNLYDGRKLMLAGIKDSQTNLAGIIQNDTLESSALFKFNSLFNNPSLFGHMSLVQSTADRIVFACTLKDGANREMSIHSGNLCLVSMTKAEKLEIQHLQFHTQTVRCQGMFVWNIDPDVKLILSMTEDGCVFMHSVGKILKQNILKYLNRSEDKVVVKDDSNSLNQIRKVIFSKLSLNLLSKVQLNPIVEFMEKSQLLKKGTDYTVQKGSNVTTIHLNNLQKIITGLSFGQSVKIVLPTRTIDNALQIGFSILQCLYFYAKGLKFSIEEPSRQIVEREGLGDFAQYERRQLRAGDFQVYGQSINTSNSKIKKIQTLIDRLNSENSSMHIVDIFKILSIFLTEIKETQNYIIEDSELKVVIESLKNLLSQVNEEYYPELRKVSILCLQIYNTMTGEIGLRADQKMNPYSYTTEIIIQQLESMNAQKTNYLIDDLYELAEQQQQVFFYLMSKYHKLPQKIFKKYSSLFSKQNDKQKHKPSSTVNIPSHIQKLLGILVCSLNLKKKTQDRDDVLLLIKNIFSKYSASKSIRTCLHDSITKFYFTKPEEWIQRQVKSVQAEQLPEPVVEPTFKNIFLSGKFDHYLSEDQLMQMDDDERTKYALMINNIDFIEEQKMDYDEENEMKIMQEEDVAVPIIENNNVANQIFNYCMRPFQNQDSYQTAYDYLVIGYTCFKATQTVCPGDVDCYLKYIARSLKKINIQKLLPPVTIAYLSLFSRIILNSKHLEKGTHESASYQQIKEVVLKLVDAYLQKNQSLTNNQSLGFSHVIKFKAISSDKISIPHILLSLLRKPVDPTPSILYVKFYSLLPQSKQFYKTQRDKIIYQKSMNNDDIQSLLKKAKKRPESWKKFANLQWLQKFIEQRKSGWQQALQLLAMYYDQ